MIKLVYVITRRANLTHAAFADYWRNTHGPLVAAQADALRMRKYVQSHLIEHPANEAMRSARGMAAPVDGITEVWWDSLEDMAAAYRTAGGAASGAILAEDESKFIDFTESQVFITCEHLIFDHTEGRGLGPDAAKVTYLLNRKSGISQAECHATWLNDHGPLVEAFAQILNMKRYVQSHTLSPTGAATHNPRGFLPPLDGITEVWISALSELGGAGDPEASATAGKTLIEDERRFVEMAASRCFLTREHLIFDHAG